MVDLDISLETVNDKTTKAVSITENKANDVSRDLVDYLVSRTQHWLVAKNKVDTGQTLRSVKRIAEKEGYAMEVGGAIHFIEKGRGPTTGGGTGAVRKAMLKKIKREGIDTSWASGRTKAQRDKSAAYVFARKIHKKGFKADPVIKPAVKDLKRAASDIVNRSRE